MLMDGEFATLEKPLLHEQISLNTCSEDEHVGDIERLIQTVKERCRDIYCTLPFNRLPGQLVIEMVYSAVFWLNVFSPAGTVAQGLSPRELLTGKSVDFNKHCKFEFGEYVQTHEATDNTMRARTISALALRPTGNEQGGHFFLSLVTGRRLNRLHATSLPMPVDVITRVHEMAKRNPKGMTTGTDRIAPSLMNQMTTTLPLPKTLTIAYF